MKKALWLVSLFLCVSAVYASETRPDSVSGGKKRNEEMYEKYLEQTGWKNGNAPQEEKGDPKRTQKSAEEPVQSKSS